MTDMISAACSDRIPLTPVLFTAFLCRRTFRREAHTITRLCFFKARMAR